MPNPRPNARFGAIIQSYDPTLESPETSQPIATWYMHVTDELTWEHAVRWTPYALATRAQATDHKINEQVRGSIAGMITRTPTGVPDVTDDTSQDVLATSRRELVAVVDGGRPITLIWDGEVYGIGVGEDLRIERATITRSRDTGQAFNVSLSLVRLQVARSQTFELDPSLIAPAQRASGTPTQAAGEQTATTEDINTANGSNSKSLAARLVDGDTSVLNPRAFAGALLGG